MKKILTIIAAALLTSTASAGTTVGVAYDSLKASKANAASTVTKAKIKQKLPVGSVDYSLSRLNAKAQGLSLPSTGWEVGYSFEIRGDRGRIAPRVGLGSISTTSGSTVVAKNNYHTYGLRFSLDTGTAATPYAGIERKVDGGVKSTDFTFGVDYDLGRGITLGSGYIRRSTSGTIYNGWTINASAGF